MVCHKLLVFAMLFLRLLVQFQSMDVHSVTVGMCSIARSIDKPFCPAHQVAIDFPVWRQSFSNLVHSRFSFWVYICIAQSTTLAVNTKKLALYRSIYIFSLQKPQGLNTSYDLYIAKLSCVFVGNLEGDNTFLKISCSTPCVLEYMLEKKGSVHLFRNKFFLLSQLKTNMHS